MKLINRLMIYVVGRPPAYWQAASVRARAQGVRSSGAAAYGQTVTREAQGSLPHPNGAKRLLQPTEAESEEAAVDGCGRA